MPVQQGIDSSPPNPGSDRSLDIRRTPSPVHRRICCRVYPVAPSLSWLYPAPAAGRRVRRPVLPHSVLALLPRRPPRVAAAPSRCCAGRAGPMPYCAAPLPRLVQAVPRRCRAGRTGPRPCRAAPASPGCCCFGCADLPHRAALCIRTGRPVQVAPPHPALLLYVSESTRPDSPTH